MNKRTILIVGDDAPIRKDLSELLSLEGYEVMTAENGAVALALLREIATKPHLVLLDISMPVMDGWTFRSTQMQEHGISSIPVIVMTADGHAPEKARKMSAQGYVLKPIIDIVRFLEEVARHAA